MGPISWSVKLHKVEKACQRQTLAYWAHMYGTKEVLRVHEHSIVQVDVESYSACSISGCRRLVSEGAMTLSIITPDAECRN